MPLPPSILVVDDEDGIRDAIRFVLEDEGYTVYAAPDGRPALVRLREHPEGMDVLLDLQMPGMDVITLLRALANDEQMTRRHVIILVTAQQPRKPTPEVAALFAQFDVRILPKPFDIADLIVAVLAAARRLAGDPAGKLRALEPRAARAGGVVMLPMRRVGDCRITGSPAASASADKKADQVRVGEFR